MIFYLLRYLCQFGITGTKIERGRGFLSRISNVVLYPQAIQALSRAGNVMMIPVI